MKKTGLVKLVVYVPVTHSDAIREALAEAGAGRLGKYDFCSFSIRGVGRFRPLDGPNPSIGTVGKIEEVEEDRIEVLCEKANIRRVIEAVSTVYPYEEMAYDIYPIEQSA